MSCVYVCVCAYVFIVNGPLASSRRLYPPSILHSWLLSILLLSLVGLPFGLCTLTLVFPNGHFLFSILIFHALLGSPSNAIRLTYPNHCNLFCSIYSCNGLMPCRSLISVFLILSRLVFPSLFLKILISAACTLLLSFFVNTHVSAALLYRSRVTKYILYKRFGAASWRKRLDARLPPLGSRVRVSVPPCGFRGGRNGVWVGFSRGFSRFPLPQISFHHFSTHISSVSFHPPLWWCVRCGRPAPLLLTDL